MNRPRLPDLASFTFGDDVVEMRRLERRRYDYGWTDDAGRNTSPTMEKARREVRVNGVLRGHAIMHNGFGQKPWIGYALLDTYVAGVGQPHLTSPQHSTDYDLARLAAKFPRWVREGKCPTPAELAAHKIAWAAKAAREEAAERRKRERWAREDAERRARKAAAAQWEIDQLAALLGALRQVSAGHNDARQLAADTLAQWENQP